MRRAVTRLFALLGLSADTTHIVIDGLPLPELGYPHERAVIGGDARCHSIAAAAIVAKTVRDELMRRLAARHPGYGWETNAGYANVGPSGGVEPARGHAPPPGQLCARRAALAARRAAVRSNHLIRGVMRTLAAGLALVLGTVTSASAQMPDSALSRAVDSLAEAAVGSGSAAGVSVAVARGGRTVHARGYGLADISRNAPVTPATIFRAGSLAKQFTAAAVMRLVEQKRLSLDDQITKFLPEYPAHGRGVLVRHLLSHTSGIRSYGGAARVRARHRLPLQQLGLLPAGAHHREGHRAAIRGFPSRCRDRTACASRHQVLSGPAGG